MVHLVVCDQLCRLKNVHRLESTHTHTLKSSVLVDAIRWKIKIRSDSHFRRFLLCLCRLFHRYIRSAVNTSSFRRQLLIRRYVRFVVFRFRFGGRFLWNEILRISETTRNYENYVVTLSDSLAVDLVMLRAACNGINAP